MSGTPMKDIPDEFASVINLILPPSKTLPTGKKFIEEYFTINEKKSVYEFRSDKIKRFKDITGKHFPIMQNACLMKDYFFTIFLTSNVFPFSTFSK